MKYENNLHIFGERIISRMKKKNLVTTKGKPNIIALYNKLYPDDIITDELIKQDRQKVTDKTRSVSDWIKGKYYPRSIKDIMDLCNVLDCSMDYLFDYNECSQHDLQFIYEYTGLSEIAIQVLHKMQGSQFGRRLRAALEILVLDVDKFNGGKYYKRFLELFSDYLQFSGDDSKRYSFSKDGEIKKEKPTHDEFGNEKYNKDHIYITSDSLKYMFIMEMEDSLKYLKKEYDKNHNFLD